MSHPIRAVTVYCSSSRHVDRAYFDAAALLGDQIARSDWNLVYGGNNLGLMGAVADAARAAGGRVIGVTPRLLVDQGNADEKCEELVVTEGMRERKEVMEQRGDAFVALPGGLGTLEEVFEVLVGKMLAYHNKPIVLLNVGGFYEPLLAMIDHATRQHFIKPAARDLFFVANGVDEAVAFLKGSRPAAVEPPGRADAARVD